MKRDLGTERTIARTVNRAKAQQKVNKKVKKVMSSSTKKTTSTEQRPRFLGNPAFGPESPRTVSAKPSKTASVKSSKTASVKKTFPVVHKEDPSTFGAHTTLKQYETNLRALQKGALQKVNPADKQQHLLNQHARAANTQHAANALHQKSMSSLNEQVRGILGSRGKGSLPRPLEIAKSLSSAAVQKVKSKFNDRSEKKARGEEFKSHNAARNGDIAQALARTVRNHGSEGLFTNGPHAHHAEHPDVIKAATTLKPAQAFLARKSMSKGTTPGPQPQISGSELKKRRNLMFQKNDHQKSGQLIECVNTIKRIVLEMSLGGISGTGATAGGIAGGGAPSYSKFRQKKRRFQNTRPDARQSGQNVLKKLSGVKRR